jgi:NarL family two-component system response regulator LiaR
MDDYKIRDSLMISQPNIRVIIVDDHDMLRQGLAVYISAFDDLELVGQAANGEEAIQLCREVKPDVVLMDLVMPVMDGVTAVPHILHDNPGIQVIMLSGYDQDDVLIRSALQAGATSYLLKNVAAEKLAEAIRTTQSGKRTLSPEIAQILIESTLGESLTVKYSLTKREEGVLDLLTKGLSNADIADQLEISKFTVKNHVSRILTKLKVSSRTEAVSLVLNNK